MGYVENHLLPGERITYRAHLHKLILVVPLIASVLLVAAAAYAFTQAANLLGVILLVVALLPLLFAWIEYTSSEFAVTDKRVVIKVGFIQRRTMETMLTKVEAIGVDQGILGRIFDFGTITVTGTGGTLESFKNIGDPLEFRRQVQAQASGSEEDSAPPAAHRDERDCPFCAERILVRAKLCKHCGREVDPLHSA